MTYLPRLLLALSVFLAFGCQDGIVQPDADILLDHKGRAHGKPGGGGEDPPTVGPDGLVDVNVMRAGDVTQAPFGRFGTVVPVGSVVQRSMLMNIRYLTPLVTSADVCFPFDDGYVNGTISLTETEDGFASATFTFWGQAQDGVTSTQYVLTLDGGAVPWDGSGWPVPPPDSAAVNKSAFDADTWTLTHSGPNGGKKRGCSGVGSFGAVPVHVEIRNIAPTVVNPGTAPFLSSPFDLGVSHTIALVLDHNGLESGCVDFRGLDCYGFNGGGRYQWSLPSGTGTEILAAAAGRVVFADEESPFYCHFTGTIVEDQFLLAIVHDTNADNGRTQTFATVYKHLSTIDVSLGEIVTAGQQIGVVSGASGCSTEPNLQFSVRPALADDESMDFIERYRTRVDPYGWEGSGTDPSLDVVFYRALNQLFWLAGQAPDVN